MSARGLLQAIVDEPGDDVPRLVYADWLEEHDDPVRAEFIRLQVRLAGLDEGDLEYRPSWERMWQLIREHGAAWQQELPAWARRVRCTFRRGFVAEAKLTLKQLDKLASLRRRTPLECAEVANTSVGLDEVVGCEVLAGLPRFRHKANWHWYSDHGETGAEVLRWLGEVPHLAGLRELELQDYPVKTDGAEALARAANLASLTRLSLWSCGVTADGVAALGQAPFARTLRELDLSCNFFRTVGSFDTLAACPFDGLTSLDLRAAAIDEAGLDALATASFLPELKQLNLSSGNFRDIAPLLARGGLDALRVLDLDCAKIGGAGVRALAETRALGELRTLNLTNAELTDEDARSLAGAAHLPNLHTLNLWANRLTDAGIAALVNSPHLPALRDLTVASNRGITDASVRALVASPLADRLVRLGFWQTSCTAAGRKLLKDRFGDRVNLGS